MAQVINSCSSFHYLVGRRLNYMGQKVNPHGFRVGVCKDWDSRWCGSQKEDCMKAEGSEETTDFSDDADSSTD